MQLIIMVILSLLKNCLKMDFPLKQEFFYTAHLGKSTLTCRWNYLIEVTSQFRAVLTF